MPARAFDDELLQLLGNRARTFAEQTRYQGLAIVRGQRADADRGLRRAAGRQFGGVEGRAVSEQQHHRSFIEAIDEEA